MHLLIHAPHDMLLVRARGSLASLLPQALFLLFLILPSTSFLGCGRRGAAGRPRCRLGGVPRPCQGPRWAAPEAEAALEAGPGSPAPRPARSNTPTRRPLDPRVPLGPAGTLGGEMVGRGGPSESGGGRFGGGWILQSFVGVQS